MIPYFVVRNSHGFSFVYWATIGLAKKYWQNVNQFFESLYIDIKTDSSRQPDCKIDIKLITKTKVLYVCITMNKISTFVTTNSHKQNSTFHESGLLLTVYKTSGRLNPCTLA